MDKNLILTFLTHGVLSPLNLTEQLISKREKTLDGDLKLVSG